MSIQSEINRISQNVADALDAVEAKGVTVPTGAKSDNLASLISAISSSSASVHIGPSAPTDQSIDIWLDTDEPGTSAVLSVNGKTGAVVLDANDVGALPKKTTISISNSWTTNSNDYTATATVTGVTIDSNSKVDLQPDASIIQQLITDDVIALYIDNNNGTLTAHAVGAAPTVALTIQCTVMEVS